MESEPQKRKVQILPHAYERMAQRGAAEQEVLLTIEEGEQFPAKFGRTGFRRNFPFAGVWRGRTYTIKQVEVYTAQEGETLVVVTVLVKYF